MKKSMGCSFRASQISRRGFIRWSAVAAGFFGLWRFLNSEVEQPYRNQWNAYGELVRDPKGILDLPKGFSYSIISRQGERMNDGLYLPGSPDGMAAFEGPGGTTILVRNHELGPDSSRGAFGWFGQLLTPAIRRQLYDGGGRRPHLGGTSTLIYDPKTGGRVKQFLSLAGTARNCAGGPTPWQTWISCEETAVNANDENEKDHGFNFEVPATITMKLADPVPLKAMGRFRHEAVAVDPRTGIVYQTEDLSDGLIYRYIPDVYGNLAGGGRLQALALGDSFSKDTRNWLELEEAIPIGERLSVVWVDVDEVESPNDDLRHRGFADGAARFARGEGMWYGKNEIFFACTSGGAQKNGQIFRYSPSPYEGTPAEIDSPGQIELFLESSDSSLLENCDNLTVAPWGDLIVCEDGDGTDYLRGINPEGETYTLARNADSDCEFAGVCFAPNRPVLFVNLQQAGLTLAVTGPWFPSSMNVVFAGQC